MRLFKKGKRLLVTAYALTSAIVAFAQSPEDPKSVPAFRKAAVQAMLNRIQKKHYHPKPLNDSFSISVFDRFLYAIDPNANILLQDDIKVLNKHRTLIDDQLKTADLAFFEAAYYIYCQRLREVENDYRKLIAADMSFDQKEMVKAYRKNDAFPANSEERRELWRKLLKFYIIRNYMDMAVAADSNALNRPIDSTILGNAKDKVSKFYNEFFASATRKNFEDDKFYAYMNTIAMEFDAHTMFTGPKDRTFSEMLNKRFFGIGVELENREGDYYVRRMVAGGTAKASGEVKDNDRILAIATENGEFQNISGMQLNDVVTMIRGEKGTSLKMKLQQPGEQARIVTLKRDEIIDVENKAKSAVIERIGKRHGYIRFKDFYFDAGGDQTKGVAGDVARELYRLRQEEIETLVIDLRGNGGGALAEVVRMCSYFLPPGPISYLKGREAGNVYSSGTDGFRFTGPLVVLVDEASGSASEIFSAAIQDYGRGLIVGTKSTFGKGTAQQPMNLGKLGDESRGIPSQHFGNLRLTMEKFYRASGMSTQLKGVSSDIVFQSRMSNNSVMEIDIPNYLPFDTLGVPPLKRLDSEINFAEVIHKANARIAANPAFAEIESRLLEIKKRLEYPVSLDMDGFRNYYKEIYRNTKRVQELRTLPESKRLKMVLTTDRNISPELRNDAESLRLNKHWLEEISQDIYVEETISILEDMMTSVKSNTSASNQ